MLTRQEQRDRTDGPRVTARCGGGCGVRRRPWPAPIIWIAAVAWMVGVPMWGRAEAPGARRAPAVAPEPPDQPRTPPEHPKPQVAPTPGAPRAGTANDDRDERFRAMMTGVVLEGTFRMTEPDGLDGKARLSEPHAEKYVIVGVDKVLEDHWLIRARIAYDGRDVTVPVTVRVVWAGDTPVLTLDDFAVPLIGTYSARVMIFRGFYGGTWFGSGHGGVMAGQVRKARADELRPEQPANPGSADPPRPQKPRSSNRAATVRERSDPEPRSAGNDGRACSWPPGASSRARLCSL